MASEIPSISPKASGLEKLINTGHSLRMPYGIDAQESLQKLLLPGQRIQTAHAGEYGITQHVSQGEVVAMSLNQLSQISLAPGIGLPVVSKDGRHYLQIPATGPGNRQAQQVELKPGELLFIGRSASSSRADKTITIPLPGVSREHAALYVSPADQTIFIEDLNSTNGISVNLTNPSNPDPLLDTTTFFSDN